MVTAELPDTRPSGGAVRRNNATISGATDGVPLVFGHGFGCDQTMWRFVAPGFEADHPVVTFDHVGCGGSDLTAWDPSRYATLHGYAEDAIELLTELALGPVVWIGHSASGMIGVLASIQRPDLFKALVLVGASPRYLDDGGYVGGFTAEAVDGLFDAMQSNFLAWSQSLAPYAMGNPERPELAEELAASFARSESDIAQQFARAIFLSDYREELRRVRHPTLIMQSSQDPMVPDAVAAYLHESIAGSRLLPLRATGHYPQMSASEETARAIRRFVRDLPVLPASDGASATVQQAVITSDVSVEELYQHAPCGYLSTTLDGTIVRINQTLLGWLGYDEASVVGTCRFADLMTSGARVMYLTHHVPQLDRLDTIAGVSLDLARSDGSVLPVLLNSVMTTGADGVTRLIRTTVFDATERRAYESLLLQAKQQAEESERRLAVLHQVATACAGSVTTETVAAAVVQAVMNGLAALGCALWLYDEEDDQLHRIAAAGAAETLAAEVKPVREEMLSDPQTASERVITESGIDNILRVPLAFEGTLLGLMAVYLRLGDAVAASDIALAETVGTQIAQALERTRLHGELQRRALHDPLTGLPNRTLLYDRLELAMGRAARSGDGVAVVVIDLDGFKQVNDRAGHARGDEVLIEVASRLSSLSRPMDTIARLGGDEFVIVCEQVKDVADAEELAQRVEHALVIEVPVDDESLRVTASVGVAVHRHGVAASVDAGQLIAKADAAMYEMKQAH